MPYSKPTSSASASACAGPSASSARASSPPRRSSCLRGRASVGVERTGEVALRRPPGRARGAVDGGLGDLDVQVAPTGELLEVVAGDVGVEVEVLGDRAGGDAGRTGVTREQVDLPAGGIAEGVRDRAHHRVELVGGEGFGFHRTYSTYAGSGNPLGSPHARIARRPGRARRGRGARAAAVDRRARRAAGVAVDGRTAVVALAVPLPGDESRAELTRRVVEAVGRVPGIERVDVDIRDMDDDEIVALAALLKGVAPPNPLQVVDASQAGQRSPAPRVNPFTDARTRVLAISSGKGGVGKSSVTTNLSVALADRGLRVAAVDADVWGFSMPRMLGIERAARPDRRRHRAARGQRRAPHLDGVLRPRGPGRHLAGPDAAQGARAVPHRRVLGRARLPRGRHAARHR